MTSMPFYKDRPEVIRFKMDTIDLVCEYAELFTSCIDDEFIVKLIRNLSINQKQTLRRAAPMIGVKKDIWEHVIPAKVIADEIIKMVLAKDISDLRKLLEIYKIAGQRSLTKEQNKLLDNYRSSMPIGWNWRQENVDPLERHKLAGIFHS
jgi:muconolactone delta-isomerase